MGITGVAFQPLAGLAVVPTRGRRVAPNVAINHSGCPKTTLRGGSITLGISPSSLSMVSHGNNSRMVADQVATEAFLAAVEQLNPNGRGSVSGREAADFAGLTLTDADLDDLIVHLIRGVPPQLVGHPPLQSGEQWVFLRLP
jgi:hypothetical protein